MTKNRPRTVGTGHFTSSALERFSARNLFQAERLAMTGARDSGVKRQKFNNINRQRRMPVPFVLPGLGGSQGLLRLPLPHQPPRARDVARSIPGTGLGRGAQEARGFASAGPTTPPSSRRLRTVSQQFRPTQSRSPHGLRTCGRPVSAVRSGIRLGKHSHVRHAPNATIQAALDQAIRNQIIEDHRAAYPELYPTPPPRRARHTPQKPPSGCR